MSTHRLTPASLLAFSLLTLLTLLSCSTPPPSDPLLVLITLDTFRADHLGAIGGYDRPNDPKSPTPNLDVLAARGLLHRRGITEIPLTLPSHASMLTGQFPVIHGVQAPPRMISVSTSIGS